MQHEMLPGRTPSTLQMNSGRARNAERLRMVFGQVRGRVLTVHMVRINHPGLLKEPHITIGIHIHLSEETDQASNPCSLNEQQNNTLYCHGLSSFNSCGKSK